MVTSRRFMQRLVLSCALAGIPCGIAAAQEPPNGDFEEGVLDPWIGNGDVGVSEDNVLEGGFSGFLTTGENAVGEVCSTLDSDLIYPPTDRARAKVAFKVRYKTDENVEEDPFQFFQDPFHAELRTAKGTIDLLTIKTDGIFWTKGDPTNTDVKNLRSPPQIPPFKPGDLFEFETRTLSVRSEIKLKGCEPVAIKFQICDWADAAVDSAAFLDAVKIRFKENGDPCTNSIDGSIMDGVESLPRRE